MQPVQRALGTLPGQEKQGYPDHQRRGRYVEYAGSAGPEWGMAALDEMNVEVLSGSDVTLAWVIRNRPGLF
jgi:hypothetical protein